MYLHVRTQRETLCVRSTDRVSNIASEARHISPDCGPTKLETISRVIAKLPNLFVRNSIGPW